MREQTSKNISAFVDQQLKLLENYYVEQLQPLQEKIKKLTHLNIQLEKENKFHIKENERLKKELDQLKNQQQVSIQSTLPVQKESPFSTYEWLISFLNELEKNKFITASNLKEQFDDYLNKFIAENDSISQKLLINQFRKNYFFSNNQDVVEYVFKIIFALPASSLQTIQESDEGVAQLMKSPYSCGEKLKLFALLNMVECTKAYYDFLITFHYDVIFNQLTKIQVAQLFWHGYVQNLEREFQPFFKSKKSLLEENTYLLPYVKSLDSKLSVRDMQLYKSSFLNNQIIFEPTFNQIVAKITKGAETAPKPVTKAPAKKTLQTNFKFKKENTYVIRDRDIELAKYNQRLVPHTIEIGLSLPDAHNIYYKAAKIKTWINHKDKVAFIKESDLNQLNKQHAPYELAVSKYYYNFSWPSIELKGNTNEAKEELSLNQQSVLTVMGYHYSQSNVVRWDYLVAAVVKYGLRKVASTLANNIKRLKGRSPNSKAIVAWEYDLQRLKKKYYDKSFSWPVK